MPALLELADISDGDVAAIGGWSDSFVATLRERLLALHAHAHLGQDELADLVRHRVLEETSGSLTALGDNVRDLLVHESWQDGDELTALLNSGAVQAQHSILDVGCSTGWMLRSLKTPVPEQRTGIDMEPRALALASRFSLLAGQSIQFSFGSAHDLPFANHSFDWVICRNAITYMNQRVALEEMTRVLKPDGFIILRFENFRYDINNLLHTKTLRSCCCRLRDLACGLIHAASGWQYAPHPGWRGRCFCSVYRTRHLLKKDNCRILQRPESLKCPRLCGHPTQTTLWIVKSTVTQPSLDETVDLKILN